MHCSNTSLFQQNAGIFLLSRATAGDQNFVTSEHIIPHDLWRNTAPPPVDAAVGLAVFQIISLYRLFHSLINRFSWEEMMLLGFSADPSQLLHFSFHSFYVSHFCTSSSPLSSHYRLSSSLHSFPTTTLCVTFYPSSSPLSSHYRLSCLLSPFLLILPPSPPSPFLYIFFKLIFFHFFFFFVEYSSKRATSSL